MSRKKQKKTKKEKKQTKKKKKRTKKREKRNALTITDIIPAVSIILPQSPTKSAR